MYKNENHLLKWKAAKDEPHTVQFKAALITEDNDTLTGDSDDDWKYIAQFVSSSRKSRKRRDSSNYHAIGSVLKLHEGQALLTARAAAM